jgi:hypothetical protein
MLAGFRQAEFRPARGGKQGISNGIFVESVHSSMRT